MSQRLHDPQVHTSEPKTILIGLHNSKVLTGGGELKKALTYQKGTLR